MRLLVMAEGSSPSKCRMGISSPTGKATWSRETISKLLNNEKYVGDVVLGKTGINHKLSGLGNFIAIADS